MDINYVKKTYEEASLVDYYNKITKDFGLFKSEKIIFNKYCKSKYKILDIGCGAGRTTIGLKAMGYNNIIGIDISEKMIQCAVENDETIDFIQADVLMLPFDDETFEVAFFSFNGLMLIPNYENRKIAVKEIRRVLKNSGLFIFSTPYLDNKTETGFWKKRFEEFSDFKECGDLLIEDLDVTDIYIHIPFISEVENLISASGMDIVEKRPRLDICKESSEVEDCLDDNLYWVARVKECE